MPVYEFECEDCTKVFSLALRVTELGKVKVTCPHCECDRVRQIISRVSVMTSKKS